MDWQPPSTAPQPPLPPVALALRRGALCRCPVCGAGRVFDGYLRVVRTCPDCAAPLGRARADDAPPYFTIFLVGHIVVPLLMWVDRSWDLSAAAMAAIFLPLTLAMSLACLRPIKGATVGAMVALNMLGPEPAA